MVVGFGDQFVAVSFFLGEFFFGVEAAVGYFVLNLDNCCYVEGFLPFDIRNLSKPIRNYLDESAVKEEPVHDELVQKPA